MGWKKIYIEGYFSWLTCGQTVSLSLVSLSLKCLKSHEAHASPNVHATCGTFIDRETSKRVKKESFMMAIPSCDDCRFPKRSPSRILWRFFSKSSGSTFPLGDACRFLVDFAAVTTNKSTRWSIVLLYGPCTMVETEGIGRLHIWASGPVALTQDCLQRSRRVSPPMIQHSNSIWKIGGSSTYDGCSITLFVYKHTALKSAHSQCWCFDPIVSMTHACQNRIMPHRKCMICIDMHAYPSRYPNTTWLLWSEAVTSTYLPTWKEQQKLPRSRNAGTLKPITAIPRMSRGILINSRPGQRYTTAWFSDVFGWFQPSFWFQHTWKNQSFLLLFWSMVSEKNRADFPERKTWKNNKKQPLLGDSGLHASAPPLASAFPTDVIDHGGTQRCHRKDGG